MTVDTSVPSVAAADSIGLLNEYSTAHNVPPEWLRAVLTKMSEDHRTSQIDRETDELQGHYTPDEMAAWQWYRSETAGDAWQRNVVEHESEGIKSPDAFDPDKEYLVAPSQNMDVPEFKLFRGDDKAKLGSVSVSTAALDHFVGVLQTLAPDGAGILTDAKGTLQKIDPRPGGFAIAYVARELLVGAPDGGTGLAGETMVMLDKLQTFLSEFARDLKSVSKEYSDAEELNSLSADNFKKLTGGSEGRLSMLGDVGDKEAAVSDG
ncbi:hypothetical protein M1L60_33405 [Actinoplanes sp. TRM 88003]|uniref:Uncharacterized protein n=1 Tax=Paractinoplanes aksuensis TaxID=2939490 RepID=A0ABT1DX98_9ACTN|nr:hypothetical protein [Actinoplanes aksuensis]MCO8275492.1 hypothetical protein [Actinoplanes aksuensis]